MVVDEAVLSQPGQCRRMLRGLLVLQCCASGRRQLGQRILVELSCGAIQQFPDFAGIQFSVHDRSIPFSLSIAESAWVALEQCVLTLPSEHPMAAAVSAVSSSSQ